MKQLTIGTLLLFITLTRCHEADKTNLIPNLSGDVRFQEFNLKESKGATKENSIVFENREQAYQFLTQLKNSKILGTNKFDLLVTASEKSLALRYPELYAHLIEKLKNSKFAREDEGALPDPGPRRRDPCTNALLEGNGAQAGFANVLFTVRTDSNGNINSVITDLTGLTFGISPGSSAFDTGNSVYDPNTSTYSIPGRYNVNANLFFEGFGTVFTTISRGTLKINVSGGCGGGDVRMEFEEQF